MRSIALSLAGVVLCATSGCFWKRSAPPPSKQRIVLHGIIDFNEWKIRPDSIALLDEAAAQVKQHENLRIVVVGHSDAKGSDDYNRELSLRRAATVRDYLVGIGVAGSRILITGKGAREPVATNETPEGRAQNRRVELLVYED